MHSVATSTTRTAGGADAAFSPASALRESEERFRLLVDNSPDAIFVEDEDGLVLDANPAACRLHGLPRERVVGRNVVDLVPPDVRGRVSEEFAGWFSGKLTSYQGYSLAADGRRIAIDIRSQPLTYAGRRAVLLQVRDVTDRKRAEERLTRLNACFLRFGDDPDANISRLVTLCGEQFEAASALYNRLDGSLLYAVGRWQAPAGFPERTEAAGHLCLEVIRRNMDTPLVVRDLQHSRFAATDPNVAAYGLATYVGCAVRWQQHAVGSLCVVHTLDIAPSPEDLEFMGIVASAIAVEEDRRQSHDLQRRLEEQMRLTQKLESLGVLAGGIAHDFNNILMSVLGFADLALAGLPPCPERGFVENIRLAGTRAAELTQQMLAYTGNRPVRFGRPDLNALLREMAQLLQASLSKKAALRFALAPRLPAIEADASQLRQVVLNLLVNASDALDDQPGTITVETGVVPEGTAETADAYLAENLPAGPCVFLRVTDTGCGMDDATRARIFDPFFTTKFVGRGLGLAVVLGIVRSHRGAIRVLSRPGEGAAFTVFLHPAEVEPVTAPPEAPPAASRTAGAPSPGLVLVVDDEEHVRVVVQGMLERHGHAVLLAATGHEGLRLLREFPGIGAVVLDITMPDMDGAQVLDEMNREGLRTPVVLSSGYSEPDVARRFDLATVSGFIQKPYTTEVLLDRVRTALRSAPTPAARD